MQDAAENEYKVKPGHKTVGSSDIIESVFGCFKNLEKQWGDKNRLKTASFSQYHSILWGMLSIVF